MNTFGERLVIARENKGFKQNEAARLLGITPTRLNFWEKDKREPDVFMLNKISSLYEVDANELLGIERIKIMPILIPLAPASAGSGQLLSDGDGFETIELENVPPEADFALRVRGDSMEPEYFDNDIVFVKKDIMVGYGQTGVFILNGEGFLKQLRDGVLLSLNPKYAPITIGEFDEFRAVGRVIGKTREK